MKRAPQRGKNYGITHGITIEPLRARGESTAGSFRFAQTAANRVKALPNRVF